MSKPKIAAAFALGFIAGSSKWLWISILCSGVLHALSSFSFTFTDRSVELSDFGGFLLGGFAAIVMVCLVPDTQSTGAK